MESEKTFLIDKLSQPFHKFIQNEKMGGVVLGLSVLVALILANSPLSDSYHHFFEQKLGFLFNG
jgi:NhaA family Na+:H+ antiporter